MKVDNPYLSTFIHKQGELRPFFAYLMGKKREHSTKIDFFVSAYIFWDVDNFSAVYNSARWALSGAFRLDKIFELCAMRSADIFEMDGNFRDGVGKQGVFVLHERGVARLAKSVAHAEQVAVKGARFFK